MNPRGERRRVVGVQAVVHITLVLLVMQDHQRVGREASPTAG
jgi:hypothetical protein